MDILSRVFNRLLYSNCAIKFTYDSKHLLYYSFFFALNLDYLQTSVLFTLNLLFKWDRIWIQYSEWMSKEIKCENVKIQWNSILKIFFDHSSCIINRIWIRLRILLFYFDCWKITVSESELCLTSYWSFKEYQKNYFTSLGKNTQRAEIWFDG